MDEDGREFYVHPGQNVVIYIVQYTDRIVIGFHMEEQIIIYPLKYNKDSYYMKANDGIIIMQGSSGYYLHKYHSAEQDIFFNHFYPVDQKYVKVNELGNYYCSEIEKIN